MLKLHPQTRQKSLQLGFFKGLPTDFFGVSAIHQFFARNSREEFVSGSSFTCNKYPLQFPDDKGNDSSMREGIPLDALNWVRTWYDLHTPKSVGREGSKAWALSVVPHFSLSPPCVAFSRVGWFSRALAFRSPYYPWGKMGDYSSLAEGEKSKENKT